jgi:methionyl-tRNA synthetase
MTGFYVTTAIPYVNAAPHLGHALELVQADVLARHRRRRGQPVRFLTGTDENALKNVTAARAADVAVPEFVAAGADRFAALRDPLSLSFDDFIRTSADPRHRQGVELLWRRCAPDLYRRRYEGRYCAGCEQFYASAELVDGRCPEHGTEPEHVAEENWFFRLSRYAGAVEHAIASGRVRIEPETRRNEVLAFVRSGLEDISVSRPAARAGGWGIPVPDDPEQVVYVWWDALANYVTALADDELDEWWLRSAERIHVVGKGIVRFHAVHWLALLTAVGLPLPTAVFVHPYLTVDGAKISKSAGTGVDPVDLVARFGVDAVRWWLLREASGRADTDFTVARLVDRADRELAGGLGNLVQRIVVLAHRGRRRSAGARRRRTRRGRRGRKLTARADRRRAGPVRPARGDRRDLVVRRGRQPRPGARTAVGTLGPAPGRRARRARGRVPGGRRGVPAVPARRCSAPARPARRRRLGWPSRSGLPADRVGGERHIPTRTG